jgi:hypothetical protein
MARPAEQRICEVALLMDNAREVAIIIGKGCRGFPGESLHPTEHHILGDRMRVN